MEKNHMKMTVRVVITAAVFILVYYLGDAIKKVPNYNEVAEAIYYLAGVVAAGCYWVGSRGKD